MDEITFGEMIRRVRKAKKMTQEEVAEGICTVSSLSKLENGSQIPSRQKFQKIMERLGESGYSYAFFFGKREFEQRQERLRLLEALEFGRPEQAEKILCMRRKRGIGKNALETQFQEAAELLWRQLYLQPVPDYGKRCRELLAMTRSAFLADAPEKEQRLTRMEMLLMNNLGLGYFWEGDCREALRTLLCLYEEIEGSGVGMEDYRKKKAVVCGNLTLCLARMGRRKDAVRYYERGIACLQEQGGVYLYLQFLKIRISLPADREEEDDRRQARVLLQQIAMDLWGREEGQRRIRLLLEQPLGIAIF